MDLLAQWSSLKVSTLTAYPLFESGDLDQTRELVSRLFCPHELRIAGRNQKIDAHVYQAPLGAVTINRLRHGADVLVDPDHLEDFLLVQMQLTGEAEVSCGNSSIGSDTRIATVLTPGLPLKARLREGCDQIVVRIPRMLIEDHCVQHLGRELNAPIEFQLGMRLTEGGGRDWLRLITFLLDGLDQEGGHRFASPLFQVLAAQMMVTTLLMCQPNNFDAALRQPVPRIAPRHVKLAEEYIDDHADRPITIVELANHTNVSTRALYAGFRRFRQTSPMAHLKLVRLRRVRQDLLTAKPGERVTAVAVRWGFVHLGEFAAAYKRLFGETPSATLRRADIASSDKPE